MKTDSNYSNIIYDNKIKSEFNEVFLALKVINPRDISLVDFDISSKKGLVCQFSSNFDTSNETNELHLNVSNS